MIVDRAVAAMAASLFCGPQPMRDLPASNTDIGENTVVPTVEDLLDWLAVTHAPDEDYADARDRLMRLYGNGHSRETRARIQRRFAKAWARLARKD
ncbi:hypothetical protein [Pontitalea aquivivens]|uniref:hypothetical protein n=1 Tax=Pontitalea aquivivens TaxID=3388663 RepID=UPI00397101A1